MARPRRDDADYFRHDTDAHADPKLKYIKIKFGMAGHGMYWNLIEHIGHSNNAELDWNDLQISIFADEFRVTESELIHFIEECIQVKLFVFENEKLFSIGLKKRLGALFEKRQIERTRTPKESEVSEKLIEEVVSTAETPRFGTKTVVSLSRAEQSREEAEQSRAEESNARARKNTPPPFSQNPNSGISPPEREENLELLRRRVINIGIYLQTIEEAEAEAEAVRILETLGETNAAYLRHRWVEVLILNPDLTEEQIIDGIRKGKAHNGFLGERTNSAWLLKNLDNLLEVINLPENKADDSIVAKVGEGEHRTIWKPSPGYFDLPIDETVF
mgnify:CR=1 FL=1